MSHYAPPPSCPLPAHIPSPPSLDPPVALLPTEDRFACFRKFGVQVRSVPPSLVVGRWSAEPPLCGIVRRTAAQHPPPKPRFVFPCSHPPVSCATIWGTGAARPDFRQTRHSEGIVCSIRAEGTCLNLHRDA